LRDKRDYRLPLKTAGKKYRDTRDLLPDFYLQNTCKLAVISKECSLAIAASRPVESQQYLYEVFEKKHSMERTITQSEAVATVQSSQSGVYVSITGGQVISVLGLHDRAGLPPCQAVFLDTTRGNCSGSQNFALRS
jgi:hypothetical protein